MRRHGGFRAVPARAGSNLGVLVHVTTSVQDRHGSDVARDDIPSYKPANVVNSPILKTTRMVFACDEADLSALFRVLVILSYVSRYFGSLLKPWKGIADCLIADLRSDLLDAETESTLSHTHLHI